MLTTVEGLPAHPLLVHAVVVLVPLTALLALLIVLWPAARRRLGGASLFVATLTLVAIVLSAVAGRYLQQHVMNTAVVRRHAELGGQLVLWSALLTISMVVWWALFTPLFAGEVATVAPAVRRTIGALAGVGTVAFAVVSAWSVVSVGRLGSQAVWGMMACCQHMGS